MTLVAVCLLTITACEEETSDVADVPDITEEIDDTDEPEDGGKFGILDWKFSKGILTISGIGEMENMKYNFGGGSARPSPWLKYNGFIEQVIIEEGVTSIGNDAFCYCSGLNSISLPESLISIGSYVFYGCSNLHEITFPNSLKHIGYAAFERCGLTSVTFPVSVEQIESWAFTKCPKLRSIVFNGPVKSLGGLIFAGWLDTPYVYEVEVKCPPFTANIFGLVDLDKSSLIVPKGTRALFEITPVWQDFGTITEK